MTIQLGGPDRYKLANQLPRQPPISRLVWSREEMAGRKKKRGAADADLTK